jgi:DNA-directed RNA polymerase specialized sigma24 family protein
MPDSQNSPDKWECVMKLLPALVAVAKKLFLQECISARDDVLPGTGKSARGLAFDAVTEFIEGGMKFRPRSAETYEKDLFNYLRKAIHNDFLDLIKSHDYQKTEVIDATRVEDGKQRAVVLEEMGAPGSEAEFYSLGCAALARKLLPLVADEPDLKEVLEAILCFGVTKREDIAAIIDKTPQEVTKRMNRMRVRLASWHRKVHASRKVVVTHG